MNVDSNFSCLSKRKKKRKNTIQYNTLVCTRETNTNKNRLCLFLTTYKLGEEQTKQSNKKCTKSNQSFWIKKMINEKKFWLQCVGKKSHQIFFLCTVLNKYLIIMFDNNNHMFIINHCCWT